MTSELLPTNRKPSSSEPVEIGPVRWIHSPTTPSSHFNGRGSPLSCRYGHGKAVGGGWNGMSVESGPRVSVVSGVQRDHKGESSNGCSRSEFVNSWDKLQTNDQHAKKNDISLGSALDWKPVKWIRSGSLSSRGSGFSHLSGCKIVGVDSFDTKMDGQQGDITLLQSPIGDAATYVTPKTPDDANSRKKPRLGWGEGLAKYEKKKVDPDDKENGSRNGMADGVSSSESLLPSPSSLPGKSPSPTGNSESASPTTPCSFACSLSPGLEEKTSIPATTVDNNTCNASVVSQNHTQGLHFSLENLDLTESLNLSLFLDELLQSDDTSAQGSGFAMDKLQVWKADISRTLEITESEIDSLEHELKSHVDSCPVMPASISLLKSCNNKNTDISRNISSVEVSTRKADVILEERVFPVNLDTRYEKAESCQDHVSVGGIVYNHREDKSNDSIFCSNKITSYETSDELSKLLPTTNFCSSVLRATDDSAIKKKVEMRKRFLKFKERVTTLKFRTFQYSWKENLRFLSIRSGAKSQKFESSSRMGYSDPQKHRASNHSRLSSSAGSLSLVPTKELVEYANMLLSDSRIKTYRNVVKMPTFILDKKEKMSSRFISDNGLVENPVDVEKERSIVKRWTVEDKEMFLDKYTMFGKNFKKIASFFQHKTVADCVEFYYKNHKSELFQKTKKKSQFAKGKSCNTNNTYLVTSEKRLNRETGVTSLDMLGAASAMVANVDGRILEQQSHDFAIFCDEQETAAADVLAGICGSLSPEALGSCITSSVDHQKVGGSSKRRSLIDVDEETCSDDSCGEEINSSIWTDEERSSFIKAFRSYGKDFSMISRCMGTRSSDQCKLFFSKARKCLGLDGIDFGTCSEGTTDANQRGGGGGSDQDDTCLVDSGSGISQDKSSMECKMDVEESDSREEQVESDRNVVNDCSRESELVLENSVAHDCEAINKLGEKGSHGILEGAADSEAANMGESPKTTCSDSASGAKVEEADSIARASSDREGTRELEHELPSTVKGSSSYNSRVSCVDSTTDHGNNLDLNTATESFTSQEPKGNDFMMANLFPQDPVRKTLSRDDVSSRLTFRKSSQRSSSIDGYQLHLHKRAQSGNDPQSKLKLDESLLLPRDGCLQMDTDLTSDAQQRRSSSLDIEKPSKSGDLKLFGKIITNHSLPKANGSISQESDKKLDAVMSSSLKSDGSRNNDRAFGVENNFQLKTSYGFWDGNRIQTGFSSLPDSAVLLAKYPAAFSNISTLAKLDQNQHHQLHSSLETGNEQCNNLSVLPGYPTRKLTINNRGPSYHAYGQSITVDKLLPEMPRRKGLESFSSSSVVSDPVAAIRMHYAKTEQYKTGGGESWRSNVSDIGSR